MDRREKLLGVLDGKRPCPDRYYIWSAMSACRPDSLAIRVTMFTGGLRQMYRYAIWIAPRGTRIIFGGVVMGCGRVTLPPFRAIMAEMLEVVDSLSMFII